MVTRVPSFVTDVMDDCTCPIVAGTPNVMRAAFTKETDFFAARNIEYVDDAFSFSEANLLAEQMFATWGERLGISRDESDWACQEAWTAMNAFDRDLQDKGRAILDTVEAEDRIAILVIGRPYHMDPGLNHGIPEDLQVLGYPVLSIRSIPKDLDYLARYYGEDVAKGIIKGPMELNHVWPENYSANSAQKVWAANFAAHHPNVAVLDLSSFKCGHDAPTYGLIDSILGHAKTPSSAMHDLDANKPGGSIKIRIKTYAHSLRLHREKLQDVRGRRNELEAALDMKRLELLKLKQEQLRRLRREDPRLQAMIETLTAKARTYENTATLADVPSPSSELVQLRAPQRSAATAV